MSHTLLENAHAVLFPAFSNLSLSDAVNRHLSSGGCSVLLGETRSEYVARKMSPGRMAEETVESFHEVTARAKGLAGSLLVAVDQEICGICRLHGLAPAFPSAAKLAGMEETEFEALAGRVAATARGLGINCFLSPILDCVTGVNPWLRNRTWSRDVSAIGALSSAFIRGVQRHGVAATAKHFPGYADIALDPAEEAEARSRVPRAVVEAGLGAFAQAVDAGVELVMLGPAIVEAVDPQCPASVSAATIALLRDRFGFDGVVMTDGLEAPATSLGRDVAEVAVDALNAGAEMLLVGDEGGKLDTLAARIVRAVDSGELPEERLQRAADRVRALSRRYSA
ncbi:glycoside hydrolase family 3 N-terminal domain-containing protein [Salidesulfovibrio onnuriiensis]|uniref:glycoside hydrolase family 3 N-terminal domain-containing protein n=1 Tax=Salidesulfovibrio onnuriiensis TaxID=2583823 RepID=UPI0011C6EB74|nr:glycoside hydrolase family 3 N-terminal domain-containing protein [Salidesulfovibrio onnuriiensis]